MLGKIYRYLADDHRRLDALLERAMSDPENIDAAAYAQFRSGLLKHIGVKEKVFLPRGTKATRRRTASRRAQTTPRSRRLRCWSHRRRRRWLRRFARFSRFITRSKKSPAVCTITANSWRKPRGD